MKFENLKPPKYFLYDTIKVSIGFNGDCREDRIMSIVLKRDLTWWYEVENSYRLIPESEVNRWN